MNKGAELGRGSFGIVRTEWDSRRREDCAIKDIHLPDERAVQELRNEIYYLTSLQHESICALYNYSGVLAAGNTVRIVTELCVEGDLNVFLRNRKALGGVSLDEARVLMRQLLTAVSHIHSHDVVHRDIKPGNIFLQSAQTSHSLIVKLGDFGLATHCPNGASVDCAGTVPYMAPEQLQHACVKHQMCGFAVACSSIAFVHDLWCRITYSARQTA